MNEHSREDWSAAFDDEADELAVRRILNQAASEDLHGRWQCWQTMRSLLNESEQDFAGIDVRAGVRAALADGLVETEKPASQRRVFTRAWPAVAAVVLAVLAGVGLGRQWPASGETLTPAMAATETAPRMLMVAIDDRPAPQIPSVSLQHLDEAQREQLSLYMLRHAQQGGGQGALGFARVASVQE